ncbi:hypothetical protein BKA70DRAFT_711205 [Coprinopsis sp. MPI-PUGE-AT-0042]|nr:hypothetical protein BKA70DRAFT_711205 [Coprinopsis sp. MPI-PUGE-AT-0042]
MIESALPLAVFGILVAASNFLHGTPGRVGFTVITGYIWEVLAMLSPQLIIYRVSIGRAWTAVRASTESGKVSSINFAHSHDTPHQESKLDSV